MECGRKPGSNLLLAQLLIPINFVFLFLVLPDFPGNTSPFREVECGVLSSTFLSLLCFFVLWGQFKGTADLLNQPCEFFRGLRCDRLNISLKNQKVLCLDEDVVRNKGSVIGGVSDGSAIEFVFRRSSGRNSGWICL